jgi:hypothetical protein
LGPPAVLESVSMSLTAVAAATQILANASKALDSLREQVKGSKDAALKENISKLYDHLLDLKAAVNRVEDENSQLRRELASQAANHEPEIRQVGTTHYYFLGDRGPFCQPCYDVKTKLVPLMPVQDYAGGSGRKCEVCNKVFFEGPRRTREEFDDHSGGDDLGWMGR